jgi:Leucine-rich repeat (LRR) protein
MYRLSGEIPEELCELTNITELNLQNNEFTGPVPGGIGNLTQLTELNLSSNHLSGT